MITESDVTADPGTRRLAARLLQQSAAFDRLSRSPRTASVVHRLRVLTRRMRAAGAVARWLAPSKALRDLARRLRRAGRALGERRTLDVAAADYAALSGGRTYPAIETARAAAETKLTRRLRSRHREAVIDAVRAAAESLRATATEPGALERFLRSRTEGLRERLGAVTKKELHALRIEAKKTRYAFETSRWMGREGTRNVERALRNLQRRLGRIHDFEVLRALLPARDPIAIRAAARESALRAGVRPIAVALKSVPPFARGGNGRFP